MVAVGTLGMVVALLLGVLAAVEHDNGRHESARVLVRIVALFVALSALTLCTGLGM